MNQSSPYKICPRCGTPNRMDAQYCVRCSLVFSSASGPSPFPPNPVQQQGRQVQPMQPQNRPSRQPSNGYGQGSSHGGNRPPSPYPHGTSPSQAPYGDRGPSRSDQDPFGSSRGQHVPRPGQAQAPTARPRQPQGSGRRPKKKKRLLLPLLIVLCIVLLGGIAGSLFFLLRKPSGSSGGSGTSVTVSDPSSSSDPVIRYAYRVQENHVELASYALYQNGSNSKGYQAYNDTFSDGTYTVPSQINGLPVTVINTYAFYNPYATEASIFGDLKVVNLPDTITFIDKNPFGSLPGLTDIHIASAAYYDVDGVLFGTAYAEDQSAQTALIQYPLGKTAENYTVPEGVTMILDQAFSGSSALKSVTLPEGVREIRLYAFSSMPNLSRLSLPASLTRIKNASTWIDSTPVSEIILASGNPSFTCDGSSLIGTDQTVYWSR